MGVAVFTLVVLVGVSFLGLAVWIGRAARHTTTQRFRALTISYVAICVAFALGSLYRATLIAENLDWIPTSWAGRLDGPVGLAIVLVHVGVVVVAGVFAYRHWIPLSHADRVVAAFAERHPGVADPARSQLSPREREVLALIAGGCLSDAEIAAALHISPATAATHVHNILRKTGVRNRRELMLAAGTSR